MITSSSKEFQAPQLVQRPIHLGELTPQLLQMKTFFTLLTDYQYKTSFSSSCSQRAAADSWMN
jgi:hypothetical protein